MHESRRTPVTYERSREIGKIGLTQPDIDSRAVVAVGYGEWELLPPYSDNAHEERAQRILSYISGHPNAKILHEVGRINYSEIPKLLPDSKVIEVVGGLPDFCVGITVEAVLNKGSYALVDSTMLVNFKTYPDFKLGQMAMRRCTENPQVGCLIFSREKYIFYNAHEGLGW